MKDALDPLGFGFKIETVAPKNSEGFATYALKTKKREPLGDILIKELSQKMKLRELYLARPTLEDIFMAATRRSWEEKREGIFGSKNQEMAK